MIARLKGSLIHKSPPFLTLDVNGVGYELEAPMSTFYQLPEVGEHLTLHTHLAVREDAHVLYGFASTEERNLFRGLIRVSGIGGKVALAILSSMSVADFVGAVEAEDALQLTRVPGIGRKTAERLIIELKDRLPQTQPAAGSDQNTLPEGGPLQTEITREAMQALQALGYKPAEASRLVRAVKDSYDSSEALIRAALQGAA